MNELEMIIKEKIRKTGPMCFAEYMELCLYHPLLGYYTGEKQKIGKTGDFYTAPHVSSLFGRTIARFAVSGATGGPIEFIEFGAGYGWLAKDITDYMEQNSYSYKYYIIEKSDYMRNEQQRILADKDIQWLDGSGDIQKNSYFILANEVLDAFPVPISEIKIDLSGDRFTERRYEPCNCVNSYLEKHSGFKKELIRTEVNCEATPWLDQISKKLDIGTILIIDYGYTNNQLSHYPDGTVNCFFEHSNTGNPYINVGRQDITSYVPFEPLMEAAQEMGFDSRIASQSAFLIEQGIIEEFEGASKSMDQVARFKLNMALKTLIMPNAMGEKFKCLVFER